MTANGSCCSCGRNNIPVIAYEDDCVTRLIQDDVNETAYNQIKNWSISELREYVLSDETSVDDIAFTRKGLTSEVVAAVAKICSNADLIYGAKKMPVIKKANTTIGIPGTFSPQILWKISPPGAPRRIASIWVVTCASTQP